MKVLPIIIANYIIHQSKWIKYYPLTNLRLNHILIFIWCLYKDLFGYEIFPKSEIRVEKDFAHIRSVYKEFENLGIRKIMETRDFLIPSHDLDAKWGFKEIRFGEEGISDELLRTIIYVLDELRYYDTFEIFHLTIEKFNSIMDTQTKKVLCNGYFKNPQHRSPYW